MDQTEDFTALRLAAATAMRRQDPATARPLLERLATATPKDAGAWYDLAAACERLGDDKAKLSALDSALENEPGHVRAMLMKADHFARLGDGRAAHAFYKAVVTQAARGAAPPELQPEIRRAERESAHYAKSYESHLHDALSQAGFDRSSSSPRFTRCLDLLQGKSQIYLQSPTAFYFPELPQRQFYERAEFPWLEALEAKTDLIREELRGVLAADAGIQPYVRSDPGRPRRDYGALLDNPDWSAFYLIRRGAVTEEGAALCPETLEALKSAPLTNAPGQTPSVLFSLLRPKTRIPPHTGYTNARLICHLPLIVPDGCGLRVGAETRGWVEGEALIFDDSMEHEAWNRSNTLRVVLLFDIWRPELTAEERALVAATLGAVGSYTGKSGAWD